MVDTCILFARSVETRKGIVAAFTNFKVNEHADRKYTIRLLLLLVIPSYNKSVVDVRVWQFSYNEE